MQRNVTQFKRFSIAAFITAATLLVLPNVNAVTPSPAMLEQFKTLPKAQQEKLMKQYGISADMLGGTGVGNEVQGLENPTIINQRDQKTEHSYNYMNDNVNKEEVDEIKRYGYDMFEGEPTTFAPVTDVPVPAEYLMGPGDVVNVSIYGKVNESFSLTVSRLGNIELPNSGPMSINGLTFETLQKQLSAKLNEQYTGVNSNVSLGELRSIRVIIAGESYKPGSYTVSSLSTITQALFVSGGVSDIASLRNIQLKRAGKNIVTFDLYDLLMKGDATKDARLQSGDVIFIPPVAKTVTVLGEVRRPAIYELKGDETANDLVKLAAGIKANSFPKASVIERFSSDYLPTLVNVDLTTRNGKKTIVKDGDVLTVKSTTQNIKNQVLVAGAVSRPGFYQWRSGMRVSDLIASQWSDLNNNVDLKYALLTREINLQGDIKTMQFSLANIFNDKNSADNLTLESRDTIVVFNKTDTVAEILLQEKREEMRLLHEGLSAMNPEYIERQEPLESNEGSNREKQEANKYKKQRLSRDENVEEQEQENKYDEDLALLYQDKELIKRSGEFTRRALLKPIINKLENQDLLNGVTSIASVEGEVKFPGEYPISLNAKITDLVSAAGGLKESAYRKQAELTKFSVDNNLGASVSHHKVALDLALNNNVNANVSIGSRDQLTILKIPSWQEKMTVSILGEVKFPGEYSVREGETLGNVIERAGGYKQQAFLNGAIFTRESVKEKEIEQIQKFTDQLRLDIVTKNLSNEDGVAVSFSEVSLMLQELENVTPVGRMVVSLSKEANDSHNQFLIEDGDMLFIPLNKQTITVVGEVQHASTHFYEETNDFDDYIRLAGGIKQRADDERIYIIQANGAVVLPERSLWFNGGGSLKPGDTIVVPLDTEYKDTLGLWSTITTIVSNAAVAFSVIRN